MNRYARQTILPQVGLSGQQALQDSKVLLVGAGGLGIPCAQSLVAAGIGQITLIDDDRVSLTNLQRQFLFSESDIGRYKVEVLREKLSAQNLEIKIESVISRFNINNALELIKSHDLVIDGSDNFNTKFLINDACLIMKTPWIYGSVSRFEGQVATFLADNSKEASSCYRCLYEKTPVSKIENCAEQGVFGAVTGIIGNYQALEAMKLLMQLKFKTTNNQDHLLKVKHGSLQVFDFQSLDQQTLFIPKRQNCYCEKPETIALRDEEAELCVISFEKTWKDFESDKNTKILFDVRSIEEYQTGHHELGQLWDSDSLQQLIQSDSKDVEKDIGTIYLYCSTGKRAQVKCQELKSLGISSFYIC